MEPGLGETPGQTNKQTGLPLYTLYHHLQGRTRRISWVGPFSALVDLPTCSILMNLFINYQVYWKTLVNVHSIKMEDFLDAKCTAACWNVGPRPALQQLQLLHLVQILHIGRY